MTASPHAADVPIPRSLLREWRASAAASLAVIPASIFLLRESLGPDQAWRWAMAATAALVYLLWELRRNLDQNVRPGASELLPTLGAGTALTLARGLFTALLAGFLLTSRPEGLLAWAPAFLYLAAAVADFFDGYAARVRNHATKLGASLDVAFDAFGVLVAVSVLVHYDRLPAAFLIVGLVYYLFHGHMKLRARLGKPVLPLQPNPYRRMYAGFLFGYFAVALVPLFSPFWVTAGGYLFVAPVLLGFLADWLFMTGALSPDDPGWTKFERALLRFLYRTLPVALRVALLPAVALLLAEGLGKEQGWPSLFAALTWPAPSLLATLLAVSGLAALGMTTAGWLGRLAALLLITLASIDAVLRGSPSPVALCLLAASIGVLLLGTGSGVLWRPEDAILLNQAGPRRAPSRPERAPA